MQTFDQWLIARLTARGFYTAASDGAYGRAVTNGLTAFQQANNLPVTGSATEATVAELRKSNVTALNQMTSFTAVPSIPAQPVWLRETLRLVGLKETSGTKSNSTILGWAKALGGFVASYYKDDSIPWCGLFMGHVIAATLPKEVLPSNPLGALNWAKFGKPLTTPALGAILVFSRTGGGHVTQYLGENATHYKCAGGNQSDSVSDDDWILKSRCVAIRWPSTGEAPVGGRVMLDATGKVSINEQ
jgi:uncharacterized protein (TIGR02594 family)